jgi:hypothetical protein
MFWGEGKGTRRVGGQWATLHLGLHLTAPGCTWAMGRAALPRWRPAGDKECEVRRGEASGQMYNNEQGEKPPGSLGGTWLRAGQSGTPLAVWRTMSMVRGAMVPWCRPTLARHQPTHKAHKRNASHATMPPCHACGRVESGCVAWPSHPFRNAHRCRNQDRTGLGGEVVRPWTSHRHHHRTGHRPVCSRTGHHAPPVPATGSLPVGDNFYAACFRFGHRGHR